MLSNLDDAAGLDPRTVGAKAAWLAVGRRAGLPVLPGVVVHAAAAESALEAGRAELESRGSGRARLAVLATPVDADLLGALGHAVRRFGTRLVVRSSSPVEGDGRWAGAFTSYVGIRVEDLRTAVAGCWASALAPDPLARAALAGVDPADLAPSVLVQPAINAASGGTAIVDGDGLRVVAIGGSPAPLLQGWDPGVAGRIGYDETIDGDGLRTLVGEPAVDALAQTLVRAVTETPATSIEWAVVDGRPVILQLSRPAQVEPLTGTGDPRMLGHASAAERERLARIAAVIRRASDSTWIALLLPWAFGEAPTRGQVASPERLDDQATPDRCLAFARHLAERLTLEAWTEPGDAPGEATRRATAALAALRGPDPVAAAARLAARPAPDPALAGAAWEAFGRAVRAPLPRVDPWLPFLAAVVLATGERRTGLPSGPGIGVGRLSIVHDLREAQTLGRRAVLLAPRPLPHLAPLLWDAAAVVTTGGGPGAHLFESARALGVPAVSGLAVDDRLAEQLASSDGEWVIAVDGTTGTAAIAPW